MTAGERPLVLSVGGQRLVAVLHEPVQAGPRGLLIAVGGPQYRVGSHRQFVLLARHLAARGVPVLRFDYRGMGDSDGNAIGFEEAGPDIAAALEALVRETGVTSVAVWGLCDAASAALLHAAHDPRVAGIALVNPWVRQQQSEAQAYLKHYYWSRVLDPAQWKRLLSGGVRVFDSARDFVRILRVGFGGGGARSGASGQGVSFVTRMCEGLKSFRGKTLVILSGDDMTAAEFKDEVARSAVWREALGRTTVARRDLPEANHTFSTSEWRDQVAVWTEQWLVSL